MKTKLISFFLGLVIVIGIIYIVPDCIFQFVIIFVGCVTFFEFVGMFEQSNKVNLLVTSFFFIQRMVVFFIDARFYFLFPLLYLFFLGFNRRPNTTSQLLVFIGFFYIGVLPDNFLQISLLNNGRILLVILVCATWARDLGGYITGLLFRTGHPIAIYISPKKTYEGAIMGGLFTFIIIAIFNNHFALLTNFQIIFSSILVAILGQMGDLTGSMFKRLGGKKDSSNIIPGQGGFLDKLDGLIFTSTSIFILLIAQ